MDSLPDWSTWLLAAAVLAVFVWFFAMTGVELFRRSRRLIGLIQDWPQARRRMVEAEARAGGRYPWWFRMLRVLLVLAMIALAAVLIWRRFS